MATPASFLLYLAEASFCLVVLAGAYHLLLRRLTYFAWNRAYLLGALAAGLLLPLAAFPGLARLLPASGAPRPTPGLPFLLNWTPGQPAGAAAPTAATASISGEELALLLLLAVYALGGARRLWVAGRNLWRLRQLGRRHPRTDLGAFSIVHLPGPDLPAFSFGRRVFLSPLHDSLSAPERQQLLLHEEVHVRQKHTADLLLVEAVGVAFWFTGAAAYYGQQLKAVHEYLADEAVARTQPSPTRYGKLLIKLAAQQPPFALVHAFANQQIFHRIRMLTQPASRPMQKFRFLLVLPVLAFAWVATACTGAPTAEASAPAPATATAPPAAAPTARIGRITWQGNTYLSAAELNQALGLKTGDAYDSAAVAQRLNFDPKGRDITSRYLDNGYLFFSVTPTAARRADGRTDLTFVFNEGRPARLGRISVVGNRKTSTAALLKLIPLRSGELFSRAKLMETQRRLAQQGQFDPAQIGLNPKPVMRPDQPTDLVDVELVLVEKTER